MHEAAGRLGGRRGEAVREDVHIIAVEPLGKQRRQLRLRTLNSVREESLLEGAKTNRFEDIAAVVGAAR